MRKKKPFDPDQQQSQDRPSEPPEQQDHPAEPPEQQDQDEELAPVTPEEEEEDVEPIGLVDADEAEQGTKRGHIKAFGSAAGGPAVSTESGFSRTPNVTGQGAIRCRIFHSKIAEAPLNYMQNQINAWLDDEEIEVKHVGQIVGNFEGKTTEPNLIVTVWY